MTWTETAHPRNMKGPGGGEFKSGSGAKPAAKPGAKKTGPARKRPAGPAHGSMSFNGKTGTGYGSKNGDPRVRKLQQLMNRLGIKDAHGKPLDVDGKLGPLTTEAIKAWQRKNGMPANGVVSPAMLAKAGKPAHRKAALPKRKPLKAKPQRVLPKPY